MLKFSSYDEAIDELLENEGLKKKAAKSGISYGTLKKVYNRGMAAWRTGHRPGTTPQQWGMARVNSYIGKGKGTYYGADSDLSGKGKKKKNEALDKKDVSTVKGVIKGLKKAVATHSSQVKTLTKDIKDDVAAVKQNKPLQKKLDNLYGPKKKSPDHLTIAKAKKAFAPTKGGADVKKEAMSPADKAAHNRAIAAFKAKGGKIKKLPPGKAQGYHGKSDPAAGMKGMMDKGDTKDFRKNKFIRSMK